LTAGIDEAKYREILLQGEFTFQGIIKQAEQQLGLRVSLPSSADDSISSSYNQIISLRQLVDAIVVHFAQENIPLDWKFEAKRLAFYRRDVVKPSKKRTAPKVAVRNYPVPVIEQPAPPPSENPKLPDWYSRQGSVRQSQQMGAVPSLSSRGLGSGASDQSSRTTVSSSKSLAPKMSMDDLEPIPSGFPVKIPQQKKAQTVVVSPSPRSTPSVGRAGVSASTSSSSYLAPRRFDQNNSSQNNSSENYSAQHRFNSRSSAVVSRPRGDSFGIAPYPEDAVAFINDAPSIVPGASRENYIEWKTRMQGALQNGHKKALLNELKDLERRMLWLRSQIK
jgi:hypothetical protein